MPVYRGPAFILNNIIAKNYATVSIVSGYSAAEPIGLEATYLKTEEPSDIARITSLDPLATRWQAVMNTGAERTVSGLALVNARLSPWGRYRFTAGAPTYQDLAPTSIINSTNRTGAVTDVDEVAFTPDANFMTPTNAALDWSVTLGGYATPAAPPLTGTARAFLIIQVALVGSSGTFYPKVTAWIYQNGVPAISLGHRAVTEASQLLIFPFDPADLPTASGALMQANLYFTPAGGTVHAKLGLARIYVETSAPTHDSGWLSSPALEFGDEENGQQPTLNLQHWPTSASAWAVNSGSTLYVQIADDQVEVDPGGGPLGFNVPVPVGEVDNVYRTGFVDAGVFVAGEALILVNHPYPTSTPGPQSPIIVEELGGVGIGGNSYGADAYRRRSLQVQLQVSRQELDTLKDLLVWRKGKSGAFYFAAEPDIPAKYQIFNSGWWTLRSMSGETLLPQDYSGTIGTGETLYVVSMEVEEKQ